MRERAGPIVSVKTFAALSHRKASVPAVVVLVTVDGVEVDFGRAVQATLNMNLSDGGPSLKT